MVYKPTNITGGPHPAGFRACLTVKILMCLGASEGFDKNPSKITIFLVSFLSLKNPPTKRWAMELVKLLKMAIEIVDLPIKNCVFP